MAYVAKILTGDLRIGLREGLVLDAIAKAFEREPATVRRAAMAAGDVGAVALAARAGGLEEIAIRYNAPIGFMLATPMTFGSSYRELAAGTWLVEDKYDGIRAQAHVRGGSARLYSRTLNEISRSFPEVIAAFAACPHDCNFRRRDRGADVAMRCFRFAICNRACQRTDPDAALQAEIPVQFVAFDLLAAGEPVSARRAARGTGGRKSRRSSYGPKRSSSHRGTRSNRVRRPKRSPNSSTRPGRAGNEGLMLKRTDAPYVPGRRGKWWLKLKRELSTLDVVVVGVEWGHGKRNKVLSDYTFAVRRDGTSGELLTIGKAYSGLTDVEIAEMTTWFLDHQTGSAGRMLRVAPEMVIEVAFDVIQKSTLHESGFSLRFPRIARLRLDKRASDADTLADVDRIYRSMLDREGVDV